MTSQAEIIRYKSFIPLNQILRNIKNLRIKESNKGLGMTLSFDPKEDLRLKMLDLEQKLAESEEERSKLEKTCNVLMRAFREEERIRYKTLNKNYEKFLQDCTVRKRRNDIILRSLCRIEDRSRALFAKTERLKLLKDRYISCLKITEFKDATSFHTRKTLPPSSGPEKQTTNDVTSKLIQWKTPIAKYCKDVKDIEENNKTPDITSYNSLSSVSYSTHQILNEEAKGKTQEYKSQKNSAESACKGILRTEAPARSSDSQSKLYSVKTRLNSPLGNTVGASPESEASSEANNEKKPDAFGFLKNEISDELEVNDNDLIKISNSREINNLNHQESIEKLKKALSFEDEFLNNENIVERHDSDDKTVTKDGRERTENDSVKKQEISRGSLPISNHLSTFSSSSDIYEKKKEDNADDVDVDMKTGGPEKSISGHDLPMGLDGVDYQNETYPESYYEQPVHHHNHTSIVADVILEEDETEQDGDEEEKDSSDVSRSLPKDNGHGSSTRKESPGCGTFGNPQQIWKTQTNNEIESTIEPDDSNDKALGEMKSPKSESEKLLKTTASDGSEPESEQRERLAAENLDERKNLRSNLIHLLESDSESFQIEHGDAVSGNEDSDFDFSFH